jgi:hypothetical protein
MLNLTKNQRADTMKAIARENTNLNKVAATGDGCSFEEGFAAGRIAVMMDMLTYKEEPATQPVTTQTVTRQRIGNQQSAAANDITKE